MSRRKNGLDIHGLILLDKRAGVSSNRALQEVKRLLNANKAGHTGSLDPLATGLLPLCFGEATKVSALMLDDDKRYEVTLQLGIVTDTGDIDGAVLFTQPVPALTDATVLSCLQQFIGEIDQVPPMYSALKHNGRKLYELAREGITIERKSRRITIFKLDLLSKNATEIMLAVTCSKGTYIRSLVESIGESLGCGATVTALRRTHSGRFALDAAWQIEQLLAMSPVELMALVMPMDIPLNFLPALHLSALQAQKIKLGQRFPIDHPTPGLVRLYHQQQFIGLGEMLLDGKLAVKRLISEHISNFDGLMLTPSSATPYCG